MKKLFWKAYLYGPAVILLVFIVYLGGTKVEGLDERGLLLLAVCSGALSGFFHVYIVLWEKGTKFHMQQGLMKYCLMYRPPIAMAFTVLCYYGLFHLYKLIREEIPPLASAIVVALGLLLGAFSYWIIKFIVRIIAEIFRPRMPIETQQQQQEKQLYKYSIGGDIMVDNNEEKKEVQEKEKMLSLKERIMSAGGFWEWIKVILLGFYLLFIPVILVFFIIDFWPVKTAANVWSTSNLILNIEISFHLRMLLLVLLSGALGSYIHVATSFSYHIARRDFEPHWYWWYWMRLPIGAALALVFIMIIEGGLFVAPAGNSDSTPITTIGIAALIGLFSRHALEKLRDIFDVVFNPREKNEGKK